MDLVYSDELIAELIGDGRYSISLCLDWDGTRTEYLADLYSTVDCSIVASAESETVHKAIRALVALCMEKQIGPFEPRTP